MSAITLRAIRALGLSLAMTFFCLSVFSQTNLGRIAGSVTDQSGGAMAGAMVTVTDVERGVSRTLVTDASGQYSAPNMTPGTYSVRAQATGFKTVERQNISLLTGGDVAVDLTLQPGEQTQTVTVTEELPIVNTTSSAVNSVIENLDLAELPINGRNYVGLSDLRPGIQTNPGGGTDARHSNGQPTEANIWMMDGLNDRGIYGGNPVLGAGNLAGEGATLVPLDTIQEVSFAENPKAEYGFGTGAVVNLGFKSGTNALHGTAYAYGRFNALEARNFFATQDANTNLEQFGSSVGGPIKKDKIFFFGGYEGKRVDSSTTVVGTLPTTAAGLGASNSFPDAIAALYKANFTSSQISQLSLNLAGCTLAAGAQGAATCDATKSLFNNGTSSISRPVQIPNFQHTDNFLVKIDDLVGANNSLHGEYFLGTGNTISNTGSPVQPYWGGATPVRGQGVAIVDVWTLNSNWVNELRGGWHRFDQVIGIGECANWGAISAANPIVTGKSNVVPGSPDYVGTYGLVTNSAQPCAMPFTTISGFTGLGNQARGYEPRINTAWKGNDGLSWTHGKHLTKFGMEYRLDYVAGGARGNSQGVITFGGSGGNAPAGFDAITAAQLTALGTPTALEDYILGYQNTDTLLSGDPSTHTINHFYAGYVQDDWRMTPKFTVNLGLRYEYSPPLSEAENTFGLFTASTAISPTGIVQVGTTPGATSRLWNPRYDDFAPRAGFAWDISGKGKTVIRAGAGWMYMSMALSGILGNGNVGPNNTPTGATFYGVNGQAVAGPVGGTQTGNTVNYAAGSLPWAPNTAIFPNPGAPVCGPGAVPGAVLPVGVAITPQQCGVASFDPNLKDPTTYYWNAGVQHAFGSSMSLDVAYVGNHSVDIYNQSNQNQPLPGLGNSSKVGVGAVATSAFAEEVRQPYYNQFPWIGAVRTEANTSFARYNSLQVTFSKRPTHGLSFTSTYVLANSKDNATGIIGAANYTDNYNPSGDYGPSNADARQRFTTTVTYAIPNYKAPLQMLSGWRVNTVIYILSRIPLSANDTTDDTSGTGVKLDKWNLVGNAQDFTYGQVPANAAQPCAGFAGSTFGLTTNCSSTLPQACITAATNLPSNPNLPSTLTATGLPAGAPAEPVNSALYNLYKFGCYTSQNGNSIILPPAQGIQGNMTRDMLRGINQRQWDASVTKEWKLTERVNTQFRFEIYNVINAVAFSQPGSNLGQPSTFGVSKSTINGGGIAISAGAQREMQMGLKIIF